MAQLNDPANPAPAYLPGPERRKQILAAAKRVFSRRGYHDTNISHICEEIRIARGTLYQYFESKREVFAAIVEELVERVRAAVETEPRPVIVPGMRPSQKEVLAYGSMSMHRILASFFEDEEAVRIVLREAVGLDGGIDAILKRFDDIIIDRFASDLELAQKAGILRDDFDPRAGALFTLGGLQKLALDVVNRGGPLDLEKLAEVATRTQMLGLLSPEVKK